MDVCVIKRRSSGQSQESCVRVRVFTYVWVYVRLCVRLCAIERRSSGRSQEFWWCTRCVGRTWPLCVGPLLLTPTSAPRCHVVAVVGGGEGGSSSSSSSSSSSRSSRSSRSRSSRSSRSSRISRSSSSSSSSSCSSRVPVECVCACVCVCTFYSKLRICAMEWQIVSLGMS